MQLKFLSCKIVCMLDKLNQMNIAYVAKEDRLLLRISTLHGDEFRIWLTRRYTGLIFNVLNKRMEKSGGSPAVAASEETRKMFREGAMEKKYDDENKSYPLGENGILAYKINTGETQDGNLQLELSPEKGQGITINLNNSLMYMFSNLLSQGIDQAGWNLLNKATVSMKVH